MIYTFLKNISLSTLLFVSLLLVLCSLATVEEKKEPWILWKQSVRLKWSDYKAKPDATKPQNALTFWGMEVRTYSVVGTEPNVEVLCYVDPNKSWVKDTTASSLTHEQLHFDIMELYTRKMRQGIADMHEKEAEKRIELINMITEKFNEEAHIEQERYDAETNHGTNVIRQNEWKDDIGKRLAEYSFFKSR